MRLIGMLDSPYVRRVAISLQLLDLRFEHESISVFHQFDDFAAINPVVKAPTLVCDDGEVLMESTPILDQAEALAAGRKSLTPAEVRERQHALRVIDLALAVCEKTVQIVYERSLRPAHKQHAPWVDRITGQMLAALDALVPPARFPSLQAFSQRAETKEGGPGFSFGLLAHSNDDVAGCLVTSVGDNAPSSRGPLVYLNAERVLDSEGARVALHSPTA